MPVYKTPIKPDINNQTPAGKGTAATETRPVKEVPAAAVPLTIKLWLAEEGAYIPPAPNVVNTLNVNGPKAWLLGVLVKLKAVPSSVAAKLVIPGTADAGDKLNDILARSAAIPTLPAVLKSYCSVKLPDRDPEPNDTVEPVAIGPKFTEALPTIGATNKVAKAKDFKIFIIITK